MEAMEPPLPLRVNTTDSKEPAMANLTIKDLTESVDLDRKAMTAITGGARTRGSRIRAHTIFRSTRIIDYPAGFTRNPLTGKYIPAK